jgi:hypothetical protein
MLTKDHLGGQNKKKDMGGTWRKCVRRGTAYRDLVRKPGGKSPLVRTKHGWENNMKLDIQERRWKCVD